MNDLPDLATVVAAVFAGVALVQASLLQKKAMQPYVVVALTPNASVPSVIEVSVKNYGPTAAREVQVRTDVTPMRPAHTHKGEKSPQPLEVPHEIAQLGPGEAWTTVWGHISDVEKANTGTAFWGKAKYVGQGRNWWTLGIKPRRLVNEFPLDLGAFDDRTRVAENNLHEIGKDVHEILDRLNNSNSGKINIASARELPQPIDTDSAPLAEGPKELRAGPHRSA